MTTLSGDDFAEMQQVTSLLMHLVDSKQWDRLSEVFTRGCLYDGTATPTGKTADGVDGMARLWAGHQMPFHVSTDLVVTDVAGDGNSAKSISKWVCRHYDDHLTTGDYVDDWVRTDEGWRVSNRVNTSRQPDAPL